MNALAPAQPKAGVFATVFLSALAGGLAWGIRGQYGHETGAMIAGVLVGFVLVLLHGRHLSSLSAARAVALFALGISVGGSMTYGQTVGLTHDTPLLGNEEAYRWGMIGLAIKGGVWIGLGGTLSGMALGGKRYGPWELLLLSAALVGALLWGVQVLNRPFDPGAKVLPEVYFSDHWHWEPDVATAERDPGDLPRRERWGGLVFALAALLLYVAILKRDALATWLGLWSTLGGAAGFPAGQSVQAYSQWHRDWLNERTAQIVFRTDPDLLTLHDFVRYFNWWNMMETTFGLVFGAIVGFGVWLHNRRIAEQTNLDASIRVPPLLEWAAVALHVRLLIAWNFQSIHWVDAFADLALPVIIVPVVCVLCGRYWPYLMCLPITLLPIAGKTLRQLTYRERDVTVLLGWEYFVAIPLVIAALVAASFMLEWRRNERRDAYFACVGLLTTTWLYFGLNFAFFHLPWPWEEWTGRTPNGLIFLFCAVCLSLAAMVFRPVRQT